MAPWIAPLERRRGAARPSAEPTPAPIGELILPESLVESHGAALRACAGELATIAYAGSDLEPHRKRQLDLALKQLYAILDRALDLAADRETVAAKTIGTLASIAEELRGKPHLVPAIYAVIGLLDVGVRRGSAGLPEEAAEAVRRLIAAMQGRNRAASLLAILPVLAEHLDLAISPEDNAARAELWKKTGQFLLDATPLSGSSSEIAASISTTLLGAIDQPD